MRADLKKKTALAFFYSAVFSLSINAINLVFVLLGGGDFYSGILQVYYIRFVSYFALSLFFFVLLIFFLLRASK